VDLFYFGDNMNAPYGSLSLYHLTLNAKRCIDRLLENKVDAIICACNTISCSILRNLKLYSPVPIFGIFPPIEKEIILGHKTLLICTETTAKFNAIYSKKIDIISAKGLVDEIEKNPFFTDEINVKKYLHTTSFYDTVILGCTHYNFVKDGIRKTLNCKNIIDGRANLATTVARYFKNFDKNTPNELHFLGECASINNAIFAKKFEF
jgi:glutamate racemase